MKLFSLLSYVVAMVAFFLFSSMVFSSTAGANRPSVTLDQYESASFAPAKGDAFTFTLAIAEPETIKALSLKLYTQDQDLVRELPVNLVKGKADKDKPYQVQWDGKDDQGKFVPNEAYFPQLEITNKQGDTETINLSENSGGEEVYDFQKAIFPGRIEYTLPVASRVLVRAGIRNGPMLRTVIDWEVRRAGFHAERWNGMDADNVTAIDQHPKVGYLIIGYQLPNFAVITHGNNDYTYRQYREQRGWTLPEMQTHNRLLDRNGNVIRSEFYTPVLQQKSPRIEVQLLDVKNRKPVKAIKDFDELLVKVELNPKDEIYLDQTRYEISFFINQQFIAEEEQGFVPFTWRFSPGRFGIKPGEHVLTINVSGYDGQVGVRNIPFRLAED